MKQAPDTSLPSRMHTLVSEISQANSLAAHHIQWEVKCLAQAIARKFMLRCRKVESTLYIGVAKENEDPLKALAWLR